MQAGSIARVHSEAADAGNMSGDEGEADRDHQQDHHAPRNQPATWVQVSPMFVQSFTLD